MKAAVLHGPGVLRCEEVPVPSIGENDVLVRVRAAGVCGSDIERVMVTGMYRHPLIPGHEFAGDVAAVGSNITTVTVGERVAVVPTIPCGACVYCLAGQPMHCRSYDFLGSRNDGGFAEFVKAPARNLIPLPDNVDYELGSATEPAGVSLKAMQRAGGVTPGCSVIVFGLGLIGCLAMQWAKALGAGLVIGVDIRDEKLAMAKQLGQFHLIDSAHTDVEAEVADLTGGLGVDLAVEASGSSAALQSALNVTRRLGSLTLIGRPHREACISGDAYTNMLRKDLNLHGVWGCDFTDFPHHAWRVTLDFMNRGHLRIAPLVTHRLPLTAAEETFAMMYNQTAFFNKVIFVP